MRQSPDLLLSAQVPVSVFTLTGSSSACIPSAHTCLCWRAALGDAPGPFACGPESQKGLEIYILPGAAPHGLWPRPERGGTPGRALSQALGAQDNVLASCSFPQSVLIWKYIPDYPEESWIVHRTSRIRSACLPGRDAHPSETPMTTSDEWAAFGSRLTLHQESQTPLSLCLFSSWGGGLASSWGHPVCAGQPWLLDFKSYKKRGAFLHSLACLVAQLCLTLCNPMDCSPPESSVHGIP